MSNKKLKRLIDQYMKKNKFDIWQLRQSKVENPFPVGTFTIYRIIKDKPISLKHEQIMFEFFGYKLTTKIEKI